MTPPQCNAHEAYDRACPKEQRQRFQIIDEVRDCRQLFERLNDTLTAIWNDMYGYAKAYYEKMGHLNIPKAYKIEDGYALGAWIVTQRVLRKSPQRGVLSEEQLAKLDEIGMCWTVREKDRWPEYFAAAEAYAREGKIREDRGILRTGTVH